MSVPLVAISTHVRPTERLPRDCVCHSHRRGQPAKKLSPSHRTHFSSRCSPSTWRTVPDLDRITSEWVRPNGCLVRVTEAAAIARTPIDQQHGGHGGTCGPLIRFTDFSDTDLRMNQFWQAGPMQTAATEAVSTPMSTRTLLVNCVVAAVTGQAAMILLHEAAHLFAGVALGHPSRMFAFGVTHGGNPSVVDEVAMLLAAPIFSLVMGIIMQVWQPLRRRANFLHLFWLFFAFASVQEMVGYLVITPFGAGDTGGAAMMLELPVPVVIIVCLVGVAGMLANAWAFAPHMRRHAGHAGRNAIGLYPWLFGTIIGALCSLLYLALTPVEFPPADQIAVMAANMAILVFAPMANIFVGKDMPEQPTAPLALKPVPVTGLVTFGALLLVNIALSIWGLPLG